MAYELIPFAGLGAKLLHDACGPSAKYLGKEGAQMTEAGVQNIKAVFAIAAHRIKHLGKTRGAVSPRVIKEVLEQSYFCEDEVQASYLGGMLASSKNGTSRDDRGVSYLALISSLSSYQLRTHFLMYSSIIRIPRDEFKKYQRQMLRYGIAVIIQEKDFVKAMGYTKRESADAISQHSFTGLETKGLSEGGRDVIPARTPVHVPGQPVPETRQAFRYFYPTNLGIELFMWGIGCGDKGVEAYSPELLKLMKLPIKLPRVNIRHDRVSFG